jgi:3-phosphoshikimate 1-carboxyvinyltransferase
MTTFTIVGGTPLRGTVRVPGDKSISHRALLLGALAEGTSTVRNLSTGDDVARSRAAVEAMGARVERDGKRERISGGASVLREPDRVLDVGNSGTSIRLLAGMCARLPWLTMLEGDASIATRPMDRITEPLRRMGAFVDGRGDGRYPPLVVRGGGLRGIEYDVPMASAQVKSAVLLAGLGASGKTTVVEPAPTRDHTELMLEAAGVRVRRKGPSISVEGAGHLRLEEVLVPGDISSAAPFLVAAALLPGSSLTVHDVGLNPRRAGVLEVLERMGVRVGVTNRRRIAGELVGDVEVTGTHELVATRVNAYEVPTLVDELPLVALLGAFAHGETVVSGAEELRAKESDRVESVTAALRAIGVRIEPRPDGFTVRGTPARPRGGTVDAVGDHRVAMLGAVAGAVSREGVRLEDADSVGISFPGFFELLDSVAQ